MERCTGREKSTSKVAFIPYAIPLPPKAARRRTPPPKCTLQPFETAPTPPIDTNSGPSRRTLLQTLALLPLGMLFPFSYSVSAKPAKTLEKVTAPIIMCQRVMRPVSRYIADGAWDKGRTNVNYCTRVLAMRKNMRDAADLLDGDAYYDALDIMGDMVNTMSQLDASLYTPLFIPADEGTISVEQGKYQQQAKGFYRDANDGFSKFLRIIPPEVLERATAIADMTKYEISIELD